MFALAETLEEERLTHAVNTAIEHKARLGQYFTPYPIARFMASLFPVTDQKIRLLDPGAGIGALSCTFFRTDSAGKLESAGCFCFCIRH
ncbi:putative modification methylase BsuBI [Treponema vincentii ATCC 35580]|uniref:Putative modification methylase BsuBI n=1 Tax=Treponema vincentii ATCC 35580 TaxID=596324 RepID=C8PPW1_9SPIR|nr:hypothetical protein [Treponema vincentii]EEV20561.1 putative modification methylase BsuBI [Treponema vincentii ATCC 35580]